VLSQVGAERIPGCHEKKKLKGFRVSVGKEAITGYETKTKRKTNSLKRKNLLRKRV